MKHARLPRLAAPACPEGLASGQYVDACHPVLARPGPGEPLDLRHTLRCGQAFRWRLHGDTWYGPYGSGAVALRAVPAGVEVRAQGVRMSAADAWSFLGLDRPLSRIYRAFASDRPLAAAVAAVPGMRLLRQDPWECLAAFVCSQNSNIPKIEMSLERIARRWGTAHAWEGGVEVASFPSPETLASLSSDDLRFTGLGYRCRYLVMTARALVEQGLDPAALRSLEYDDALAALMRLPGVGRKVADCALLFSMDKPQAFPVDVWVRRVLHECYRGPLERCLPGVEKQAGKALCPREHAAMLRFAWDRWGMLAGYAGQYLFHARRHGFALTPGQ